MKNYIKLLNFEINRFFKLYMMLFIVIFIIQFGTVLASIFRYTGLVKEVTRTRNLSPQQFVMEYSEFSLTSSIHTLGFVAPIAIGVVGLMFYLFLIWYRDWFAKNSFIYRLLMLPTNRMNIFWAKLTTIMLTVLGIVAYQIVLLQLYRQVVKWIIPVVYRDDLKLSSLIAFSEHLQIFAPNQVVDFLIAYGLGLAYVIVMFTAILFERSFQWLGVIYGVLYTAGMFFIFILPLLVQFILLDDMFLFFDEIVYIQIVITILISVFSLFVSNYLLHKKITV